MNLDDMKTKYLNKQFLTYYAIIFVLLYVFFSFIRFLGQLPILLIITFFVTYYITDNSSYSTNTSSTNINSDSSANNTSNTFSKITSLLSSPLLTPKEDKERKNKSNEPEIIIGSQESSTKTNTSSKKTPPLGYNSFS